MQRTSAKDFTARAEANEPQGSSFAADYMQKRRP